MTATVKHCLKIPPISLRGRSGRSLLDIPVLSIPKGTILAVTGPSGSGKSLFLKALFGWVGNAKPFLSPKNGAFFLIQDPLQGLTPGLSLDRHMRELPGDNNREREDLLQDLGLSPALLQRLPSELSGGERQRMMLALVLLNKPKILVCDEPAASVDEENEARLWQNLVTNSVNHGTTLIVITHRLSLIEKYAHRVLVLGNGNCLFFGETPAFFSGPRHPIHKKLIEGFWQLRQGQGLEKTPPQTDRKRLWLAENLAIQAGNKPLLKDVSFEICEGQWCWLLGPSGSGKTSLAKTMAGLRQPYGGCAYFQGALLAENLKDRSVRQKTDLQLLFQFGSASFNPYKPVASQLKESYREKQATLLNLLKRLQLQDLSLNRPPGSYSLGELQRLNLIRAFGRNPKLLICDELFTPLDLNTKMLVLRFLEEQCTRRGLAVLAITHEKDLVSVVPASTFSVSRWAVS